MTQNPYWTAPRLQPALIFGSGIRPAPRTVAQARRGTAQYLVQYRYLGTIGWVRYFYHLHLYYP